MDQGRHICLAICLVTRVAHRMGARDISVRQSTSRFKDAAQLGSDSYRGKISLSLSLSRPACHTYETILIVECAVSLYRSTCGFA